MVNFDEFGPEKILEVFPITMNRNNLGRFSKGTIPWNKGKKGIYSKQTLERMSNAKKGKRPLPQYEFKKGHVPWNRGLIGVLKTNRTSYKIGRILPKQIEEKRIRNLRKRILIKPNLNMSEDLAYILGVLKGDGCVCKYRHNNIEKYRVALNVTDKNFALCFYKSLRKIGLNPSSCETMPSNGIGKKRQYIVHAYSKILGMWYKKLTLEKLKKILDNENHIVFFLKGFYEAEGSLYLNKKNNKNMCIRIFNSDESLLSFVKYLTDKIGFSFNFYGPYSNHFSTFANERSRKMYNLNTSIRVDVLKFMRLINPCTKNIRGKLL